jgi:hypothetical protein
LGLNFFFALAPGGSVSYLDGLLAPEIISQDLLDRGAHKKERTKNQYQATSNGFEGNLEASEGV